MAGGPHLLAEDLEVDYVVEDAQGMTARTVEDRLRACFELMPYAYRDPSLRRRIAALNQWHVATSLAIIVGERADSAEVARSAQGIAHLVFAAVDGIELHYDMDPAGYPLDEVFELLLGFVLAETRRLTGGI